MIPLVSRSRARRLPKPIQMDWTPQGVEAASVLILILSACLWFSQIKHKASRYTARGCLIRQNNIIDLKTEASQLCCFILPLSLSSPYRCPLHPPQPTPFKTIKTCFWNVIKLRRVQLSSRPRRQLEVTGVQRREGGEPAWPAWRVKCRFAPWASWETPLLTVSGREAAPISFIQLRPSDEFRAGSQAFTALTSHLHACFCVCLCLQFPAAGGAPRGWITPCTAPMFWRPSPRWLCPTSFTPPTGNPPT